MNNFQKVFKNTFFLTLSEIFLKIIGFLWVIFLARSLSVSEYGRYNLVNSLMAVFSFLPDLGVGLIVIREIAKDRKEAEKFVSNSLILRFFLSLLTVMAVLVVSLVLGYKGELMTLIAIASFTLFISNLRSVPICFFEGLERMEITAFLNSANSLLLLLFALMIFLLGFGLKGIFLGMSLGTLLSLFLTWMIFFKFNILKKIIFNLKTLKFLVSEGLPLGLAAFAYLIYTNIDSVVLSRILGEYEVGIYNSATPFIISFVQIFNVPFMAAIYPALSRIYSLDNPKRFSKAIKKSLLLIVGWSFPLAIIFHFLSPIFIPLVFGIKYQSAIPVLKLLIFFVPFASISALLYKVLMVVGKQKIYLVVSLLGAFVNIFLNLLLIPKFLIYGAALASVFTQIILFLIYFALTFKYVFV